MGLLAGYPLIDLLSLQIRDGKPCAGQFLPGCDIRLRNLKLCDVIKHLDLLDLGAVLHLKGDDGSGSIAFRCDGFHQGVGSNLQTDHVRLICGIPFLNHFSFRIQYLQVRAGQLLAACDILFRYLHLDRRILHYDRLHGKIAFYLKLDALSGCVLFRRGHFRQDVFPDF